MRQSRPAANGYQALALAAPVAFSGTEGLKNAIAVISGSLRRSDVRRSVGNALEVRIFARIRAFARTLLGDVAG